MRERWAGPIVVVLVLGGVIALIVLNLDLKGRNPADAASDKRDAAQADGPSPPKQPPGPPVRQPAGFREYPIGDAVQKNNMRIRAVWLPSVAMEGMEEPASSKLIHLEADISAAEGNPNGFAKDEFVPYLVVDYTIVPVDQKESGKTVAPIHGRMMPMVASDGLHYGATIEMPGHGHYKLNYAIQPPSAGGLGRHVDAVTGVAPWWKPFEVSFDWEFSPQG